MRNREELTEHALGLLRGQPDGLRFSEMQAQLSRDFPHRPVITIKHAICALRHRDDVLRPRRGFYVYTGDDSVPTAPIVAAAREEWTFYSGFASFIGEAEGCTRCIVLGGAKLGDRWGTPDIIGRCSPSPGVLVPYADTIIAGELKLGYYELMTAFGQACAYKLFSHKSYLAVPKGARSSELRRLEQLCVIVQVGLVLYDETRPEDGQWELRVRPQLGTPDMACVNEKLALIRDELWGARG